MTDDMTQVLAERGRERCELEVSRAAEGRTQLEALYAWLDPEQLTARDRDKIRSFAVGRRQEAVGKLNDLARDARTVRKIGADLERTAADRVPDPVPDTQPALREARALAKALREATLMYRALIDACDAIVSRLGDDLDA